MIRALALLLALIAASSAGAADEASFPVTMTIDAGRNVAPLPPVWRFFGADEPNYVTRPDGAKLLLELGSLRPGQVYFRAHNLMTSGDGTPDFKWGSTNIYSEKEGKPVYDWSIVDHIIDTYRARGIHPYLELGFMPQALSSAPKGVPYRRIWRDGADNSGASGWAYPPKDDRKWAELIYQWTRHNVARYGRAEVDRWYFEVWNEPNLDFYWRGNPQDYLRLHDYAIAAVRHALPTARVGGPDVAGDGGAFMDTFLKHVTVGRNYATGRIGTPTDFVSFHAKGQPSVVDGRVEMGIAKQLQTVEHGFARIAAVPGVAGKPVVIGENDPEGCAACAGPANAYRNGVMYSSYEAAIYPRIWALAQRQHINLAGALTWAFTYVGQPWFAGYRQLATNGIDLPVFNVFRLFARLGPERISATSSAELPLETIIADGVRGRPDVGTLATRSPDGRIDILVWHYHDDDVPGPAAAIDLRVAGVSAEARGLLWRVDRDHADAFTAWRAMGRPQRPDRAQRAALFAAAQLHPQDIALDRGGLRLKLPRHGVALIELRAGTTS